jgi:hypothetical protein
VGHSINDLLSEEATKAMQKIFQEHNKKEKTAGISLKDRQQAVDQVIRIIIADVDGKDGAFDGKIDQGLVLKKIEGKNAQSVEALLGKGFKKFVLELPTETIDGKKYINAASVVELIHKKTDPMIVESFKAQDVNKDGILNKKDDQASEALKAFADAVHICPKKLKEFLKDHPEALEGKSVPISPKVKSKSLGVQQG